jgi:ornithine cyclodeaminase
MIGSGVHINAVGGDCPGKTELQPDILDRASVFVEYLPQTRIEGEIQQKPADFPATELWRVIAGEVPGRAHRDEITLFDSVGFAIEDFSALRYLDDVIGEAGLYRTIDLLTRPSDPRDLFGVLAGAGSTTADGADVQLARQA